MTTGLLQQCAGRMVAGFHESIQGRRLLLVLLALALLLSGCRTETQNRIRRDVQNIAGQRMYVRLYDQDGKTLLDSISDGLVSRSVLVEAGNRRGEESRGNYIFWFDDRGTYFQTDLTYYIVSSQEIPPISDFR